MKNGKVQNPAGKTFHPPTDYVAIVAGEHELNISQAMRDAAVLVKSIEDSIYELIADHNLAGAFAGADLLIRLDFSFFHPAPIAIP